MNYSDLENENQALRSEVSSLKQIISVSNRTIYIEKYNDLVNKYNSLLLKYKNAKEKLDRYSEHEKLGIASMKDSKSGPVYTYTNIQPTYTYKMLELNRVVKLMSEVSVSEFRNYLINNGFSEKKYTKGHTDYSFHRWGKANLIHRAVMNDRSVNSKGVISISAQKKFGINIDFSKYTHVFHKNGDIKVNDLTISDFTDIVRLYVLS